MGKRQRGRETEGDEEGEGGGREEIEFHTLKFAYLGLWLTNGVIV